MAKKMAIPWELKYKFALGGWASSLKGFMYAIRKKYGAAAALEMYEMVSKMDGRVKNMTHTLKDVFNIEGNDMEAIEKFWTIYHELTGNDIATLELSKTFYSQRITKCSFKTEPIDISEWCNIFVDIIAKTLNPKTTFERLKSMCEGDPYCEYVAKLEE